MPPAATRKGSPTYAKRLAEADVITIAQRGGGDDRADIALEEVGAHAGHVADVVAHVVGNHGRVAGIVFGDARFDLADQVRADIGRLGVDAATDTGKEGDAAGAKAKTGDVGDIVLNIAAKEQVDQ